MDSARAAREGGSTAPSLLFCAASPPVATGARAPDPLASIVTFRESLAPAAALTPVEAEANRQLARAAEALSKNDVAQALDAATLAAQLAPDRLEPLEVLLLVRLARAESSEVREVMARIVAADPCNAIALAFGGLEAMQRRDPARALAKLSWFVGPDAMVRRGAAIPLPTAPGELEETAAMSALQLGAYQAAIDAIDAALLVRAHDVMRTRALALLRADALSELGRDDEALSALMQLRVAIDASDAIPMLVALRIDRIHSRQNDRMRPQMISRFGDYSVMACKTRATVRATRGASHCGNSNRSLLQRTRRCAWKLCARVYATRMRCKRCPKHLCATRPIVWP